MTGSSVEHNRREKLAAVRAQGVAPYPSNSARTHSITRLRIDAATLQESKEEVTMAGRVRNWRPHGKLTFATLEDGTGKLQALFRSDELTSSYDDLAFVDLGDIVEVTGTLTTTKTGELTVAATSWKFLSKSLQPLPEKFHGLKDQELRYRKRYLDLLVNPAVRDVFIKRSAFITNLRAVLNAEEFLEVETPVLQPVPGGALARPFTTRHNALDVDLYLRVATELYLKRLIVGGFERVYEIGPDFRNEGISTQHLQEFTMCEFYAAYWNYERLMTFTEDLFEKVLTKTFGTLTFSYGDHTIDFTKPWPRLNFVDVVLEKTGIDVLAHTSVDSLRKAITQAKIVAVEDKPGYSLWKLIDNLYKAAVRETIVQPTFLVHHPVSLLPLAKHTVDDPRLAESAQLIAGGGLELVKLYSELNDPDEQRKRFTEQSALGKNDDEAHAYDKDFIEALEYGMPPTAGWGMGIDRVIALLTNQPSVRDVVLFPMLRPADVKKKRPKK